MSWKYILYLFHDHPNISSTDEFTPTCGQNVDLDQSDVYKSGILKVTLPEESVLSQYRNSRVDSYCDITISFTSSLNLMIELYYVDIIPESNEEHCTTGLEVFESSGDRNLYGQFCFLT